MAQIRGWGEGTWKRRKNGLWEWQGTIGGKRQSVYGPTQTAVRAELKRIRDEESKGVVTDRTLLSKWLEHWRATVVPTKPGKRDGEPICAKTLQSYDETLALIYPRIKGITLDALDADHIDRLLADLAEAGYARTRIKRVYFTLKDAIDHAVARRKKSWNPVAHATFPVTAPPRKGRALTANELAHFRAAAPQDRLGALYLLGFATGTRPGEYAGLEWSRVDLSAGTAAIDRALSHDARELGDVKTTTRTVGLPSWAVDMLRVHKKRQLEERLAAGPAWHTSDLVFTTEIGTPLDMRRVNRRNFKRICSLAGIEGDVRPYDTRHTVASQMLDAGVSIEKVADVLGNSPMTVARYYRHPVGTVQDANVSVMEKLGSSAAVRR